MKKVSNVTEIKENVGLLIGNFDGVHLGHQKLISDTLKDCESNDIKLFVVTFVPHPVQILKPRNNFLINTYKERQDLLEALGIDYFMEIPFDRDISTLGPREFLDKFIFKGKNIKKFYLGHDFAFGANKEGNSDFVQEYCHEKGINFTLEKKFITSEGDVSSSIVRDLIVSGEMVKTNFFLNRSFFVRGRIIKGEGRGKKIGFPTANLDFAPERIVPAKGVYITRSQIGDMLYQSVTNIGINPTFKNDEVLSIETFLLDFDRDIYGEEIEVIFLKRLRDEKKFSSVNKLIDQISSDVNNARKYFEC